MSIDLFLFSQQIASTNIGKFAMSPTVSESMTVSVPINPLLGLITTPLFILSAFIITSVAAVAIVARRSRKRQEEKKRVRSVSATEQVRKLIPKPPKRLEQVETITRPRKEVSRPKEAVYCIYCGEQLPSHALYCRKCGKNVE